MSRTNPTGGAAPNLNARVWNHSERMENDPDYRARYEAYMAQPEAACSVPGCERTEPCGATESGWCGHA